MATGFAERGDGKRGGDGRHCPVRRRDAGSTRARFYGFPGLRMRFRSVTLQDFRNLRLVQVALAGRRTFLCGANGQGKSNFLEALGYLTALRSFRGADPRGLIGLDRPGAGIACEIEHEVFGESRVTITLSPDGRVVEWERGRVTRLADFIGRFPTVVFSAQDNQLLRGAPAARRRWLDLTLAAADAGYLGTLQGYTRATAERNLLLKQGGRDGASLAAFEHEAAAHAVRLIAARTTAAAELAGLFGDAHRQLVPEGEAAGITYAPDTAGGTREDYAAMLARTRPRDLILKSTLHGPHRDDLEFTLNGRGARLFASEGQQRCLVLALRLAQAAFFRRHGGIEPVLLCDDVLGELDAKRRELFWGALGESTQVIATGTVAPTEAGQWQILQVARGEIFP